MARAKSINVGAFGATKADGTPVPQSMVGRRIYYSSERGFFLVLDENQNPLTSFYPDKFLQFVDAGAIVFTNDTIRATVENECRARVEGTFFEGGRSHGNDEWGDDFYEDDFEDARRPRAIQHGTPDSEIARPSASTKDPTRHLGTFFAVTLILVIIFSVVILFGNTIIQGVGGLLP